MSVWAIGSAYRPFFVAFSLKLSYRSTDRWTRAALFGIIIASQTATFTDPGRMGHSANRELSHPQPIGLAHYKRYLQICQEKN
jgi:hypothetical protein